MKFYLIPLLLLITISLNGQTEVELAIYSSGVNYDEFMDRLIHVNTRGNQLAFDDWREGTYVTESGDTSEIYLINYHTNAKQVFLRKLGVEEIFNLNEQKVNFLLLTNPETGLVERFDKVEWHSFKDFPDYQNFCIYLINKRDFKLIKYFDKELKEVENEHDVYTMRKENEYKSKLRYYYKDNSNTGFEEISFSRNGIITMLNIDQLERMKDYLKLNKHRWKDEGDMIKMLK